MSMTDYSRYVAVRPDERQIKWQKLSFTAFFHFGVNTFTNSEWGTGKENPQVFNPEKLNTDQWCKAVKAAGIKACILTVKHHDGFCLWDTAYTGHGVMASKTPVDIASLFVDSCCRHGLKPGFYLSPWDRHEPSYGTGNAYDDFFCGQLEELTTGYGQLYALWFDGACGEETGSTQQYTWDRYYAIIRKNQPQAVISIMGPDVRWIGNEAGITRESEWSVVPTRLRDREAIAAASQHVDSLKPLKPTDEDLGSAHALKNETELCWYPAEVDVSIRPGWFYHPEENDKLRTVDDMLHIYETSVGGNAVLLLNIPPDTDGRIHRNDEARLKELGDKLREIYGKNLNAKASATDEHGNDIDFILKDNEEYWRGNTEKAMVKIHFSEKKTVRRLVLCEQISQSQRIESFEVYADEGKKRRFIFNGTTVGYKKICVFDPIEAGSLEIKITNSREYPTLRLVTAH